MSRVAVAARDNRSSGHSKRALCGVQQSAFFLLVNHTDQLDHGFNIKLVVFHGFSQFGFGHSGKFFKRTTCGKLCGSIIESLRGNPVTIVKRGIWTAPKDE